MAQSINRREFMTASAGIAAGLGFGAASMGAQTPAAGRGGGPAPVSSLSFKTKPHKALIAQPTEDDLRRMKDAGFEGVEGRVIPVDEAAKMRVVADKIGMRIHSVSTAGPSSTVPTKARSNERSPKARRRCAQPRRSARSPSCWCRAGLAAAAGARAHRPRARRWPCRARGSSRSSSTPRTAT